MGNSRRRIGTGPALARRSLNSRSDEILRREGTCYTPCFDRPLYRLVSIQGPIAHVFCRATYLGGRTGQARATDGQGRNGKAPSRRRAPAGTPESTG